MIIWGKSSNRFGMTYCTKHKKLFKSSNRLGMTYCTKHKNWFNTYLPTRANFVMFRGDLQYISSKDLLDHNHPEATHTKSTQPKYPDRFHCYGNGVCGKGIFYIRQPIRAWHEFLSLYFMFPSLLSLFISHCTCSRSLFMVSPPGKYCTYFLIYCFTHHLNARP